MSITRMLFPKGKRGVSTVLGTLIFIGILFTSVVPMYLVMRQADTLYDQKVAEMKRLDEERANEEAVVYVYPLDEHSDQLEVRVENTGATAVNVVRLWINDEYYSQDVAVASMETKTLGLFNVTLQDNCSYCIMATTVKGNVFSSISGVLYYSDGIWYTPSLGISVNIANIAGKYHIRAENGTWSDEYLSQGMDFGDVIHWFDVKTSGTYTVTIEKYKGGNKWVNLPGTPITVVIQWPGGTPIVYVYASGIGI